MNITETSIPGLKIIELKRYADNRGYFIERFHAEKFAALGLPSVFPQDNHSRSYPGVVRGLHYQHTPPQGKLVGTIAGAIWDVAVDVRPSSPTYGQHVGIELSEDNGKLLWMPPGFAHGFMVIGDKPADVLYKVSELYNMSGEEGIAWDDPDLNVAWPIIPGSQVIISDRDRAQKSFAEYKKNPVKW